MKIVFLSIALPLLLLESCTKQTVKNPPFALPPSSLSQGNALSNGSSSVMQGQGDALMHSSESSLAVHVQKRISELAAATLPKTEEEWKKRLTPPQYNILRQAGTEAPFSSPLDTETRPGTYYGADCGEPLFRSEQKYDSGTGWPSFWAPISPAVVELRTDTTLGEARTEVVSKKCGGHLGHVFDDGPPPTRKRYCMNGLALIFVPDAPLL